MSYKSLLFCPDDRTARMVTQVLNELEFTVEPVGETFAAVKQLSEERFDALVVDCQNEQDASLLFKAARNSSQNHSSLSVAVVEGQAGVAKAFRIGANLVLTKPINVEQSKSTLRVARGLLRKNEPKPVTTGSPQPVFRPAPEDRTGADALFASKHAPTAVPMAAGATISASAADAKSPFSDLELEAEPTPEPEAAEAAVLESLPELPGSRAGQSAAAVVAAQAEPIAASSTGTAAAAAPAPEKPAAIDLKPSVMPPMVTNEPIVAENSPAVDPFADAPLEAPSFSSLDSMTLGERRGGGKVLKVAAVLVIIAALGYVGWQKLHPLQYLHLASTAVEPARDDTIPAPVAEPASIPPSPSAETQTPTTPADTSSTLVPGVTDTAPAAEPPAAAVPRRDLAPETIEVQELPISRDAKPAPAAPKPQPLVVKSGAGAKAESVQPPPLQVATTDVSNSALAGIMPTNAVVPKVAPGSLRVSQGVSQGLLLKKVPPRYPPAALQMRKEGTVELQAAVGKDGSITSVQVLSGDPMLARSAVDAVRQWKYRPYLLNGEPVEIQTQITINFKVPH